MMIVYYVCLFVTLAIIFVGTNESWVRRFNIKFGLIPESNMFTEIAPYLIVITMICGIAYLRGLIV